MKSKVSCYYGPSPGHSSMATLRAGSVFLPRGAMAASRSIRCFSSESPSVIRVAAIAGSLRKASFNQGLVRAAIEVSKDIPGLEVEHVKIDRLPFVNTDLEADGRFPDAVEEFRAQILKADSILFASPEYNYSMSGVLKNAIDWASRSPNCWADKPAAIMSAGGMFGGGRSQYHLRQTGVFLDLHFINKPELFVKAFESPAKFDADGNLIHEDTRERVKSLLLALQTWTRRIQ
ncbi:hypothetical protein KP509_33G026700 [Ceratopteris richardii]|uniref:NAD(P)H dehydrogenase (quinone) n=1 Tax=Ceratopteris richardii TaxID=49495 RepID=A0A8T2QNL8_CERRI|nr:hypothetical protein KP509_33G026700 [Ceratopteris richardii]KAH7285406.1 hypothetical protein KP509_33G026700 [Ceratopteris richardii]